MVEATNVSGITHEVQMGKVKATIVLMKAIWDQEDVEIG